MGNPSPAEGGESMEDSPPRPRPRPPPSGNPTAGSSSPTGNTPIELHPLQLDTAEFVVASNALFEQSTGLAAQEFRAFCTALVNLLEGIVEHNNLLEQQILLEIRAIRQLISNTRNTADRLEARIMHELPSVRRFGEQVDMLVTELDRQFRENDAQFNMFSQVITDIQTQIIDNCINPTELLAQLQQLIQQVNRTCMGSARPTPYNRPTAAGNNNGGPMRTCAQEAGSATYATVAATPMLVDQGTQAGPQPVRPIWRSQPTHAPPRPLLSTPGPRPSRPPAPTPRPGIDPITGQRVCHKCHKPGHERKDCPKRAERFSQVSNLKRPSTPGCSS